MKKVAIVALSWNKLETTTKLFLDSLYKFTNPELFDLIFVDNASTDGSADYIENFAKDKNNLFLIRNNENEGYSKGNNIGIKHALKGDYQYIGLLNNDILFTPNWLENVLACFDKDEQLGIVSTKPQKKMKLNQYNYLDKYQEYLAKSKEEISYTIEPLFCCAIIKREVFDKIGLLDENFTPAFWEDNDFCFRTMYAGYSLAHANKAFAYHNHGSTSGSVKSEIFERNREYFFRKHPLGKWVWEHKRTNIIKDIKRYIKSSF